MTELEPHEVDMVYGGDHWGYEASEDWAAMARSYSYGTSGFWGPSYPSCTGNVQVQTRSETTTGGTGVSITLTGSFPYVGVNLTPKEVTTHTTSITRTVNCTY